MASLDSDSIGSAKFENCDSLLDLIRSRLSVNSVPENTRFESIPSIRNPPSSDTVLTNKIHDLNINHTRLVSDTALIKGKDQKSPDWAIDLTQALRQKDSLPLIQQQRNKIVDDFVPEFVDCEVNTTKKVVYFKECCLNIEDVLRDCRIEDKECSNFGKLICKSYVRKEPYIPAKEKWKHEIVAFKFDTRSPCDTAKLIWAKINRDKI